MTTASSSSSTSLPSLSSLSAPFTPSTKRKRINESPLSYCSDSPSSIDDEDDDASTSSSSRTATGRTPKTTKASAEMDPVRAARLEARAARNRVSAQHSRNRKKNHVQNLEAEVAQLRSEKAEMSERINALEGLVKTLLSAGAANAKGGVDPASTLTTHSSSTSANLPLLSTPSSPDSCSLPISLTPQALSQRASDSSLAAPTDTPLPAVSSTLLSPVSFEPTFSQDFILSDARLPAAEAIECNSFASQTQQRASLTSNLKVETRCQWEEGVKSRLSEWMSQSMAAAEKQTKLVGWEQRRQTKKKQGQLGKNQSMERARKAAGLPNTSKDSTNRRRTIRIRVRIRKVNKSKSRKSKSMEKE